MPKRLTPPQQKVLDRLWAGEHLCWNYHNATYQLSGGSKVANVTFRSLLKAGLISAIEPKDTDWIAAEKGGGDGT